MHEHGLREHLTNSPVPMALLDGGSFEIRYANPALRRHGALLDLVRSAGSRPGDLPVARRLREILEGVVDSRRPQPPVELAHDEGDERGIVVWRIVAWPGAAESTCPPDVLMSADDVSAYVREREARSAAADEMREVNERLVLATLYQEELRERAQAASDAKSAFLATMSHELRTPLTAIIGYEELLHDGITGPVTTQQREQLARIKHSATHLLALIDDVLTLARSEARQELLQLESVEVAPVVERALSIVAPLAFKKGLDFASRIPEALPELRTDPLKLRQILVNLLGNAVKFCEAGAVSLRVEVDARGVTFIVADTGIGIAPQYLDKVFDPFFQIQQTTTRRVGGSGLGLSVSRRLARLMGGDVTVESRVGVGTTFRLYLPAAEAREQRQAAAS